MENKNDGIGHFTVQIMDEVGFMCFVLLDVCRIFLHHIYIIVIYLFLSLFATLSLPALFLSLKSFFFP